MDVQPTYKRINKKISIDKIMAKLMVLFIY